MGLSSPLPCLQTARPSGCKGARNARKPATTLVARPALAVSRLRSLASHAKLDKAGANRKCGPEARMIDRPNNPDMCTRFPLSNGPRPFPPLS
jgi:hypothetical protein